MMWLLVGNVGFILFLSAALAARIYRLFREDRQTRGGARLRLRIIALFGVAAMVPTVVVAAFLGTLINRSVESWFSDRVYSVVDNAAKAAQASLDTVVSDVTFNLKEAATDLNAPDAVQGYTTNPDTYNDFLRTLSAVRDLPTLFVLSGDGAQQYSVQGEDAPAYSPHSQMNWIAARNGQIAVDVTKDLIVSGMVKLSAYEDAYLYAARQGPQAVAAQLQATQDGLTAYRDADERKNALRTVFILSYLEAAMLVLLGTAWLGMSAAGSIVAPIGELAAAARAVRDGDLNVRLERPTVHDEIDDLAEAFNQMTMRLARQNRDLERGRVDAETRSAFIETVLAGVEAGVIRVDSAFTITIANASAARLLSVPHESLSAASLPDIAPEFIPPLRRATETRKTVGANLKWNVDEGQRDIHVRISPEAEEEGFILTFHDTSRLVAGQRQAAWRDVARRIAHEIRNPLTPIQLSAERLRRRFGDQIHTDRDTYERCLSTILRQVSDIGRMVEEFSSFARMPKPTLGPFDVGELAKGVAFAQRLAAPSVRISCSLPDEKLIVVGDERLLGQALTNVVKNACESVERRMKSGGDKSGSVSVSVQIEGENALLTIRDTGEGFPTEDRERFLEPYVTTRDSGVGLGLAIVTRVVEDHGGRISLSDNDEAGYGARVDILLPVAPELADSGVDHASQGAV